jgi:hypothetical protein
MSKKRYPAEEPVLSRKSLLSVLDDRAEVTNLIQCRPYTCITLLSWYDGKEYIGYGFSKVMYPDKWEDEQGAEIAYGRALRMIMRQVRGHEKMKSRMEAWDALQKEAEHNFDLAILYKQE